jgi:hypothetical protein
LGCRGIFDVNMPLLYGEGEKAFARLQEAILNSSEDQSLFAWSPSRRPDTARGTGILFFAQHPREFADSRGILPTLPRGAEPTALTSKGLRINLPIQRIKGQPLDPTDPAKATHLFLAVLYCIYDERPAFFPAIVLRRHHIDVDMETFVRHESEAIRMVRMNDIRRFGIRQVYLRRNAPTVALKKATITTYHLRPRT